MSGWIDIGIEGLAQILERRGKEFAVLELFQNVRDLDHATECRIKLVAGGSGYSELSVEDDDPAGFSDLADAYTMFKASEKKGDPTKAGRFNQGEKLVLALCKSARISSTKGTVAFIIKNGERQRVALKVKRDKGTLFEATIRMSAAERSIAISVLNNVVVPPGLKLIVNDVVIPPRVPVHVIENVSLTTEWSDVEGNLRRNPRQTTVSLYEPPTGYSAMLYELGIPVCSIGDDRYDIDVAQRVPLSMERDSVTPAYLRTLRAAILNATVDRLDKDEVKASWVTEAMISKDIKPDVVREVVHTRFPNPFRADPNDPEGKRLALGQNRTEVPARAFPKEVNDLIREHNIVPVAAKSPTAAINQHLKDGNLDADYTIPREKWTANMHTLAKYATWVAREVFNHALDVVFVSDIGLHAQATYNAGGQRLLFNKAHLGNAWLSILDQVEVDDLILHELSHEGGDHLEEKYSDTMSAAAARWLNLARSTRGKVVTDFAMQGAVR